MALARPTISELNSRPRLRATGALAVLGALATLASACGSGTSTNSSTSSQPVDSQLSHMSAQDIVTRAISAGTSAGSVHIDAHLRSGKRDEHFVGDAAPTSGRRMISGPTDQKTTELQVGTTAYFQANASALSSTLGFGSSVAQQIADKWVSIPQGEPNYSGLTNGLTLPSLLAELPQSGPLGKTKLSTVEGQEVIGVTGTFSGAQETLYISATGSPIPVEIRSSGKGVTQVVTFSKWGTPVTITAPTNAIQLTFRSSG